MRWALVGLVLVVNVVMALAMAPARARVMAIAPPLTHVPGLGVDVLAQGAAPPPDALRRSVAQVIQATGDPTQREAARGLEAPPSARQMEGQRLRAAVQADGVAMVQVLGAERVRLMLEARPTLAAAYGELTIWASVANEQAAR